MQALPEGEQAHASGLERCAYEGCGSQKDASRLRRSLAYHPTKRWCSHHRRQIAKYGRPGPKDPIPSTFLYLKEDVEMLARQGYTRQQIAERLGLKWDSISTAYRRNKTPVPFIELPAQHPGSRR